MAHAPAHRPDPVAPAQVPAGRPRRRYHFHWPGLVFLVVVIFLAVGAINSQNNLLFASLGLAIGALLLSGFMSGSALMGLRLARLPATPAVVGRPLHLRVELRNASRVVPAMALHLRESPADPSQAAKIVQLPLTGFCQMVAPRGGEIAVITRRPTRRGRLVLGRITAWSTFPFGLTRKSVSIDLPQSVVILPAVLPLRRGVLRGITTAARHGTGATSKPGAGEELFGVREYVPGDSPRRIAWRASARTGTLVVRQNAAPSPTRLWITLSIGQGASDRDVERAVALAASAVAAAIDDHVAVGLALPGGLVRTPRQGQSHGSRLLHDLAQWSPSMAPPPWPPSADRAARLTITAGASAQAGHGAVWRAERAAEMFDLSVLDESGLVAAGALDLLPPPPGRAP